MMLVQTFRRAGLSYDLPWTISTRMLALYPHERLGLDVVQSYPYRPQSNGEVKRFH